MPWKPSNPADELVGSTWGREPAVQRAQGRAKLRPMLQLTAARAAYIKTNLMLIGYTAPEPRYGQLIDPCDDIQRQRSVEDESGCMLKELGAQDLTFRLPGRVPYVNGSAPLLLRQRANGPGLSALKSCDFDNPPQPGDTVWYSRGPGGPEHVETVLSAEFTQDGSQAFAVCGAGGERTDADNPPVGRETIARVERTWEWSRAQAAWVDTGTGRSIMFCIDCDDMALLHGLR
jgi:hypothetical protein